MYLKMIALAYWEMGRKGFPESDLMLTWEPRMCLPKVSHFQVWNMRPRWFLRWNLTRNQEKYAPCLPLSWVEGESLNSPWMGQVDPLNLLRSCALTLDKCALATGPCVTVAEEQWKTCVIFPMTRVCLSTSKSTNWCLPPGIHWTISPEMRLSSLMTSNNLHNDELGRWPFLYSFPKP